MRTTWVMLGALLASIILMDIGKIWVTYNKVYQVMEQALDAALVGGTDEEYAQLGILKINDQLAEDAAIRTLQDNLKLNGWSNNVLEITDFDLTIHQDPNNAQVQPYAEGRVSLRVFASSPRLFGQPGYPIDLTKTQFQVSDFK